MSKGNTPEGIVLSGCLRYLQRRGIYHWRNSVGAVRIGPGRFMHFGLKGSSGILPGGRFLAVECKAPEGGRLSPEQRQFLDEVKALGGLCLVVKDWKDIDNALRKAGYISDGPLFSSEGNNAS
jgi:hypothetical protein